MLTSKLHLMNGTVRVGAALVALAAVSCCISHAQDGFGYVATSAVPYSYLNISGTGTAALTNTDDGTAVLTLPFPFRFYGTSYTSLCASANGVIAFGGCPVNDFTNLDLTAQTPPGDLPLIAPFWMDLTFAVPGAGGVVYQTLGNPGSRQFVVQWSNTFALNSPGALNFQVVLQETSNVILFQYQSVDNGSASVTDGASATVGIRGAGSQSNNDRIQWSYRAPVLSNSLAISFTPPASVPAVDVSASIGVTTSAFTYNRLKQTYSGSVTITNIGTAALNPPLTIVLTNLSPGVTAIGPTGNSPGQGPYYAIQGSAPFTPGSSSTIAVQFTNPSNARISFVVKTYSGNF
jgi:hypothetical protein